MVGTKKLYQRKDRPKKRKFYGNRFTNTNTANSAKQRKVDLDLVGEHEETGSIDSAGDVSMELQAKDKSASYLKLSEGLDLDSVKNNEALTNNELGEGLRLFRKESLVSFIQLFPCPSCFLSCEIKGKTFAIEEKLVGINTEISATCNSCGYVVPTLANDENLNLRFQLAMYGIGCHERKGRRFLAAMDMPPPVSSVRASVFKDRIREATKSTAAESMKAAASEVKAIEGEHITVGCDGSWQRRGFSSKNGVATCLSISSCVPSKVIDTDVQSNYCDSCCKVQAKKSGEELEKSKADYAPHCMKNHHGSAGSMEPAGIKNIFARSEEKYGLKYTGYLGDGDSKSYKCVAEADPPVYDVEIEKLECCGHVQKRMGKRLLDKVSQCKSKIYQSGKRKVKGSGGAGKLTKAAIKRIQGHYGGAIRKNVGNLENMKSAIWAIYYHRKGEHNHCGEWCNGNDKNRLPDFVLEEIKSVFQDLSDERLLRKCLHGGTQNANESFHHLVWDRCPKSTFVGRDRLEIAVNDAAIVFNDGDMGRCEIFKKLGLSVGRHQIAAFQALDRSRVMNAERLATTSAKKQRAKRSILAAQEDSGDEVYVAGGF